MPSPMNYDMASDQLIQDLALAGDKRAVGVLISRLRARTALNRTVTLPNWFSPLHDIKYTPVPKPEDLTALSIPTLVDRALKSDPLAIGELGRRCYNQAPAVPAPAPKPETAKQVLLRRADKVWERVVRADISEIGDRLVSVWYHGLLFTMLDNPSQYGVDRVYIRLLAAMDHWDGVDHVRALSAHRAQIVNRTATYQGHRKVWPEPVPGNIHQLVHGWVHGIDQELSK